LEVQLPTEENEGEIILTPFGEWAIYEKNTL
jgi:hypothetical protein